MRGKHSIVTPESTVRRRLKLATTALVPAMVLASLGVASAEMSADEQLAKEIECDIPGAARTDCIASVETEDPAAAAPAADQSEGDGAAGADEASTGEEAAAAGAGSSQELTTGQTEVPTSGSSVIDNPQGFADNLSCEMMDRFEMSDLQCDPAS